MSCSSCGDTVAAPVPRGNYPYSSYGSPQGNGGGSMAHAPEAYRQQDSQKPKRVQ
jgi:hypothetical protein